MNLLKLLPLLLLFPFLSYAQNCNPDLTAPVILLAPGSGAEFQMMDDMLTFTISDIVFDLTDECDPNPTATIGLNGGPQGETVTITTLGPHTIDILATDQDGNTATSFYNVIAIREEDDCLDDITPPVAICDAEISVTVIEGIGANITTDDLDKGSYDECSGVSISLVLAEDDDGTIPGSTTIHIPDSEPGTEYFVIMYVVDEAGNVSACFTTITIAGSINANCAPDLIAPTLQCVALLQITTEFTTPITITAEQLHIESEDNCSAVSLGLTPAGTVADDFPANNSIDLPPVEGTYELTLWATDESDNMVACNSTVEVTPLVSTDIPALATTQVSIAPHPLRQQSQLRLTGSARLNAYCEIYDMHGRLLWQAPITGGTLDLSHDQFPANGCYIYRVIAEQQVVGQGRLIVQ